VENGSEQPGASHQKAQPKAGDLKPRKITARSRVTNGYDILPNIDQRSMLARRYRDITTSILSDQGGLESCAEARLQLIRRFSAAAVIAEQMEARMVAGEPINIMEHAQLTSSMVRVAQRIGINRRSKNVTPTVRDYLEAATVQKTEAAE
jgi:hypothetical protein